jgi:hypothetical protein
LYTRPPLIIHKALTWQSRRSQIDKPVQGKARMSFRSDQGSSHKSPQAVQCARIPIPTKAPRAPGALWTRLEPASRRVGAPPRGQLAGEHQLTSVSAIIRVMNDKGPGINRDLVDQFKPELVEAWHRLELAHAHEVLMRRRCSMIGKSERLRETALPYRRHARF